MSKNIKLFIFTISVLIFTLICIAMFASIITVSGEITDISWTTRSYVQQYNVVSIVNRAGRPPKDAYDISSHQKCTYSYNQNSKQMDRKCHTEYDYKIDRWVDIYYTELQGTDRFPVYPKVELVHAETGYGNQRLGYTKLFYTISAQFDAKHKSCTVSQQMWEQAEVGNKIRTSKNIARGFLCSFKLEKVHD